MPYRHNVDAERKAVAQNGWQGIEELQKVEWSVRALFSASGGIMGFRPECESCEMAISRAGCVVHSNNFIIVSGTNIPTITRMESLFRRA